LKISGNYRVFILFIILLFFGTCFVPPSISDNINQNYRSSILIDEGQILFSPSQSTNTYLINSNGELNHSWPDSRRPGEAVYMLEDGSILHTNKLSISGGGAGGAVRKISWDGTKTWDFTYYTDDYLSHHDIEPLPNGNILMIAWEYKTRSEAIKAGRNPNKLEGDVLQPDHIIEVEPTGPTSGDIVWEWHAWDHLIQDFDPSQENYGSVEDHPELIDINFGTNKADWLHTNSIDYNEEFDQILLSVRFFCEIWIIDHSTTTEEAAGHTGGNSGKGGDLLYRWGNPQAYDHGTSNDKKFFDQHDARWIDSECPGAGHITVFNNGVNRPGTDYTSVEEIISPVDENGNYEYTSGTAYGPEEQSWIYNTDFYAWYIGGAQRLPSGNTLIVNGPTGEFIEVTPEKEIVWEYENPYPNYWQNNLFKFVYYPPEAPPPDEPNLDCDGSLNWNNVEAGTTLEGDFQVKNIGDSGSLLNWKVESYPNWGTWSFDPESGVNLTPENSPFEVKITVTAPDEVNKEFEGYIRIVNQEDSEDYDVIPVYLKTPKNKVTVNLLFWRLFEKFPLLQKLLFK
jgi:hypothetical protein